MIFTTLYSQQCYYIKYACFSVFRPFVPPSYSDVLSLYALQLWVVLVYCVDNDDADLNRIIHDSALSSVKLYSMRIIGVLGIPMPCVISIDHDSRLVPRAARGDPVPLIIARPWRAIARLNLQARASTRRRSRRQMLCSKSEACNPWRKWCPRVQRLQRYCWHT